MVFAALSDPLLRWVLVVSLAVFALCASLLLLIVLLHLRLALRERRLRVVRERWRRLMTRAALGDAVQAPPVDAREGEILLPLFNELCETVQGKESLAHFARGAGLDRIARGLLASGSVRRRLLAINTVGHVGPHDAMAELEQTCAEPDPIVSLAAARALLRLDPGHSMPRLVPMMLERGDWSIARLAAMLAASDLAALEIALTSAMRNARGTRLERLLLLAEVLPPDRSGRWARRALRRARSEAQLAAALRLVSDPRDAPLVRRLLDHSSWRVRVRAVTALERVAGQEDLPRLVSALSDPEWWVRLRAARALARLPMFGPEALKRLSEVVSDRFARDALRHAIAEEGAG